MRDDSVLTETLSPHQTRRTFDRGSVVFREGAPPSGVYVLLSGSVDLHFKGRNGDEPLTIDEPGTILGLSSMMAGRPQEYTATAASPLVTGYLDADTFHSVLNAHPTLWLNVLRILSRDISSCYDRVRELSVARHHHAHA